MRTTTKVAAGLFGAWLVHDLEELVTLRHHCGVVIARIPQAVPLPARIRADGLSQTHVSVAVGAMGGVVAGAAVSGMASRGRSTYFRAVLLGFGLHGFGHLLGSAVTRRYTPGVVTAGLVVIPFWLRARGALAGEGVRDADRTTILLACSTPAVVVGVHLLTGWALARREEVGAPQASRVTCGARTILPHLAGAVRRIHSSGHRSSHKSSHKSSTASGPRAGSGGRRHGGLRG